MLYTCHCVHSHANHPHTKFLPRQPELQTRTVHLHTSHQTRSQSHTLHSIHKTAIKDTHRVISYIHQPWHSLLHTDSDTHTHTQTVMMACVWEVNDCLLHTTFTLDYTSRLVSGRRATTPGHWNPFCHRSHMLTTFITNVNVRLRTLCAKWHGSNPSWKSNRMWRSLPEWEKTTVGLCHLWNVHNKPEEGKWFFTAFDKTKINTFTRWGRRPWLQKYLAVYHCLISIWQWGNVMCHGSFGELL